MAKRKYDQLLEEVAEIKQELAESQKSINEFLIELFNDEENESIKSKVNRISTDIDDLKTDIEEKKDELNLFYEVAITGTDTEKSIKTQIENEHIEIKEILSNINNMFSESEEKLNQLKSFHKEIFGTIDDAGESVGGYREELLSSIKNLSKYKIEQSKKYDALFAKIESLLPGATSAGLASAFKNRKDVFAEPNKKWTATFVITLIIMFIYSACTFKPVGTLEGVLTQILNHMPLYIPAIWLAIFASQRKSENKRLEEEYSHRESLANSFIGYKRQIEELNNDDSEALKEFLNNILHEIAKNPSETLDKKHGDSTPLKQILDRLIELKDSIKNIN